MNFINYLKNKLVLSTIFAVIITAVFHKLFLSEIHTIQFRSECNRELEYQVFWTEEQGEKFCETRSTRKKISKGRHFVEIDIPTSHLHYIRLDIGSQPGNVRIENLAICGTDTIGLNTALFKPSDIEVFKTQEKDILITTSSEDPFIIYSQPVNSKKGKFSIAYVNLFLILISAFYFYYVLCNFLENRKIKRKCQVIPTLQNVEFLRIYFTFSVLAVHFCQCFGIWCSGTQAVQFFFLLSGYLLALTFKPEKKLSDIALKKWIRFVPLVVIGGILSGGGIRSFAGIFMLQNTGLYEWLPNAPAWYIGVLFWCTLFYNALLKYFPRPRILIVIASISFIALIHSPGDVRVLWKNILPIGMLRGISCMGIGIILAQLCRRRNEETLVFQRIIYSLAEFSILCYIIVSLFDQELHSSHWCIQIISHVLLLSLFIVKRGYISSLFEKPIFTKLASYSLAVYLTHWMFRKTVYSYVQENFPGWMEAHVVESIIIAIIGSCVVGVLARHLVEKPCTRYLTRFFAWMKDGSVAKN